MTMLAMGALFVSLQLLVLSPTTVCNLVVLLTSSSLRLLHRSSIPVRRGVMDTVMSMFRR